MCRPREIVPEEKSERKAVQEQPEAEDYRRTAQHVQHQVLFVRPLLHPFGERKRHRHADDPEEERKDEICKRPPVPCGMPELGIDVTPCARDC